MIKSNYLLLSEGITWDQITWLASVYNILEKFQVPQYPLIIPKMAMLCVFEKKNESSSTFEIDWKLYNNDILLTASKQPLDFEDKSKHKWLNILQSIEIKEPWELVLSIYYKWEEINRYVIEVETLSQ